MIYEEVLKHVLDNGIVSEDRTGTGTLSVFCPPQIRYDLQKGFPLITTKKVHFKSVAHELLWFISGSTNIEYLKQNGVTIWDEWADEKGNLGPIYGHQLRNFGGLYGSELYDDRYKDVSSYGTDQLLNTIEQLKTNPNSRRHVITLWNPEDLDKQALHCCHGTVIQFYVRNGELSCSMYQRSADMFLGVPFNIASYALFTEMVAQVTGLKAKELIITLGDGHIYSNHIEQVQEQLSRNVNKYSFPKLELNSLCKNIADFQFEDIKIWDYESYPAIKGKIAV